MHWFVGFCGTLLGFVDHSDILWIADAEVLLISVRSPLVFVDHYVFKDRGFCSPAFIFRFILFVCLVFALPFFCLFCVFFCND